MATDRAALYLAIDQGGHASRALVFDQEGRAIAQALHEFGTIQPAPDRVEQDAEALVSSVLAAIRHVVSRLGQRRRDIAGAGLATQRSSIACWDRGRGTPLSPVISWQDRRAKDWLHQFESHADHIHQITGLFLSAHYGASKLRWCLDHLQEVKAAHKQRCLAYGPVASFLLFRLLLEQPLAADPANASRTLLWNRWTNNWDPVLLELFGVPVEPLPDCVLSRHAFGTLRVDDCEIPMVVATGDQSAALFAMGEPDTGTAYVNIGTGAFVQRLSARDPGCVPDFLTSLVFADKVHRRYVLEGTVNGAGSALRWFEDRHHVADLELRLPQWLARDQAPPLFLNGVSGLGSPYWIANFKPRFVGDGRVWQKAVAVVESIVFLLQTNLDGIQAVCASPARIQISGGVSQLNGICQRLADLSGMPVYRPAHCEATARGLAFLVAGAGHAWPEPVTGDTFEPRDNRILLERYQTWRDAMGEASKG
ncbi:MAG: FGGY family carbohydrate kinase [Acidiferrobacterales bacterium]